MPNLRLLQPVGKNCANRPEDVKAVHEVLVAIGKLSRTSCDGTFDEKIHQGILSVQQHFLRVPDGVISVGGRTHEVLRNWSVKPIASDVELPGRLRQAWDLVNPLLPAGSNCSSGYRSAEKQRALLHEFFKGKYKSKIIAMHGREAYAAVAADLVAHEQKVLAMVRGAGQKIAAPGRSMHQQGKAIDVGGPHDQTQKEVIERVARANPQILSGYVITEANGCVHFEIC